MRGEEAPASTLLEAADALRGSALLRLEGDGMNQGPALRVLLQDLRSLAQGAAPEMWIGAELGHALLEVSVGAGRAERRQILQVATELAEVSPTGEIAGELLRAGCQVAESVLYAQGARPASTTGSSGRARRAAGIDVFSPSSTGSWSRPVKIEPVSCDAPRRRGLPRARLVGADTLLVTLRGTR